MWQPKHRIPPHLKWMGRWEYKLAVLKRLHREYEAARAEVEGSLVVTLPPLPPLTCHGSTKRSTRSLPRDP